MCWRRTHSGTWLDRLTSAYLPSIPSRLDHRRPLRYGDTEKTKQPLPGVEGGTLALSRGQNRTELELDRHHADAHEGAWWEYAKDKAANDQFESKSPRVKGIAFRMSLSRPRG